MPYTLSIAPTASRALERAKKKDREVYLDHDLMWSDALLGADVALRSGGVAGGERKRSKGYKPSTSINTGR